MVALTQQLILYILKERAYINNAGWLTESQIRTLLNKQIKRSSPLYRELNIMVQKGMISKRRMKTNPRERMINKYHYGRCFNK